MEPPNYWFSINIFAEVFSSILNKKDKNYILNLMAMLPDAYKMDAETYDVEIAKNIQEIISVFTEKDYKEIEKIITEKAQDLLSKIPAQYRKV